MQKLQLYIGTQRLELFKDETVSFTQTLKNVKDITREKQHNFINFPSTEKHLHVAILELVAVANGSI